MGYPRSPLAEEALTMIRKVARKSRASRESKTLSELSETDATHENLKEEETGVDQPSGHWAVTA